MANIGKVPSQPPIAAGRRPRRDEVVTYRVRIDIKEAKPPIWRRLELGSDMLLNDLHEVIQASFGWTDSHLHRFSLGTSVWDPGVETYLSGFDLDDGDLGRGDFGEADGIAETDVRLDEVLVEAGDRLQYVYDYGDSWEHVVRLEKVIDRSAQAAWAVCTDGRRGGPPEDCGGIGGYEELLAQDEEEAEEFDLEDVNDVLSMLQPDARLPGPVAALLRSVHGHPVERPLAELISAASLAEPARMDLVQATPMVRRYVWLLDRVGEAGIKLTESGYLPPVHVAAASVELNLGEEWIGKGNREIQTMPVLELRESAQKMGLLRKQHGRVLVTKQGQELRRDPVGLWWHLVARALWQGSESIERKAGLVSLLGVAAGQDINAEPFRLLLIDILSAMGWRNANGTPLGVWSGTGAARETVHVLRHMGAFTHYRQLSHSEQPTPGGVELARAILQLHT